MVINIKNLLFNTIYFCLLITSFNYNITTSKYNYKITVANAVKIYK